MLRERGYRRALPGGRRRSDRRAGVARGGGPAHRGDLRHAAHPRRVSGRPGRARQPEAWCIERTVRTSGRWSASSTTSVRTCSSPRSATRPSASPSHLIGLRRGIPVLFLLYTIFPEPAAALRGHAARADRPARRGSGADRRGARGGGGVPPLVHRGGEADPRAPAVPVELRRAKVFAGHVRRRRGGRPRQRLPRPVDGCCARTSRSGRVRARPGRSTTARPRHGRSSTSRCTSRTTTRSRA